jgi:anti-anti-sigma factor
VIDLAKVTFMDSTGLGALVTIRNASHRLSKQLSLRSVPERVQKLLAVTGLDRAFVIDSSDEAPLRAQHARQSA